MPKLKHSFDRKELENTSLLKGVEFESIQDLLQGCPVRNLKKGAVLISAGQPSHFLYLLLSGRLRIHLKLKMRPLTVLEPGEIVGELSVIDGQPASAYVIADEDCRLLALDEKTMWSLIETSHAAARNLLVVLSQRLRDGNRLISLVEKFFNEELSGFDPEDLAESQKDLLQAETADQAIKLYQQTVAYVLDSIQRAQEAERPDIGQGEGLVRLMMASILDESDLLLLATDRRQEFSVSTHCVNVAILGLRVAQTLKYKFQRQIKVGLAGLLHEIGVVKLANRVIQQGGQVSNDVEQRSAYSAQILTQLGPEYAWLAETVGQVFERENGTGSPLGLAGQDIREEAKILGVTDVFEACIHNRPYRKALTGYQFLHELTSGGTKSFSDHIVKAVIESFSLYPYNEYVILNTDEVGQVVEVNAKNVSRPMLKILFNSEGEALDRPREMDLAQHSSIYITKAITYDTLEESG